METNQATAQVAAARPTAAPDVLVRRLFARISEISTLPAVAMRVVQVANDPSTGSADLLEAVRFDTAMATRIMRTVNSSYYGMQNKVGDLKLAITLLGFKEIRNLAMTAYVAQMFKTEKGHGCYTREGLWNHMIGVAIVSRLVSELTHKAAPREAYLAGLLHDLGYIFIDQYLNKPFAGLIDVLTETRSHCDLEEEILGFNHAALGGYVAGQWRLPEHLVAAIDHHHDPLAYQGEHWAIVYTVAVADFFCHAKGASALGVRNTAMPAAEVFAALGLQKSHMSRIWSELDDALRAADVMAMMR